ncbi:uncharacterized protein LOC144988732 [Oryzias latipes]
MNQWEEPQEVAPPSISKDGNHDNQSKAQGNQPGPGPEPAPESSWGSKRGDISRDKPPDFKVISSKVELTLQIPKPGSSCGSYKSKSPNPDFKDIHPGVEQIQQRPRTDSGSSCESNRSDVSKSPNPYFKDISPEVERLDQQSSETPSGPSVQQHQTQLDSIFLLLEDNIVTFVKEELKKIQKLLSHKEDEEELEDEDEEQRSSRESLMKITVNFLRRMKQEDLADGLQSSKRISLKVSAAEK